MLTLGMGSLHVAFEWALIFAAIFVCERFWHPLLNVFTVVLIAARQYALLILMHEATHYRLLKNRRLKDVVADLFLAWPTLLGLRGFRCNHLAHHRFLNSLTFYAVLLTTNVLRSIQMIRTLLVRAIMPHS